MSDTMKIPEENRRNLKIAAVITKILGIAALILSFLAGIAATYFLATNFVIAGVLTSISAFRSKGWIGADRS